ncbi:MAG TPA: cbb3-type cytochrome c oxidase subunit I, partial [Phototrophicaceae bacterium]|nr:cbb3-type cytochrome c oxidase subunit I [Phototrophicaceae bacterium]
MSTGIYHWFPKITGRLLNERWGKIHFLFTYVGFFFTFFPMHIIGMLGMPRRVAVYFPEYQGLNALASFGAFTLGISTFFLVYNIF